MVTLFFPFYRFLELFRDLPVRRTSLVPLTELHLIKQRVLVLALANPQVSFSLFDAAKGVKIVHTRKVRMILLYINI